MLNATRCLVAAAVIAALAPAAALAEPVIDITSSGTYTGPAGSPGFAGGFSFTVGSSSITVVALDAFLAPAMGQNSAVGSATVRLYSQASPSTILASATVTNAGSSEGDAIPFYSAAPTQGPVVLAAGGTYDIVEDLVGNNYWYRQTSLTANSAITYDHNVSGTVNTNPTADQDSNNANSYFGPNFDIAGTSPSVVPEPSSLVLCGTALVGLAGYRLRRARRLAD